MSELYRRVECIICHGAGKRDGFPGGSPTCLTCRGTGYTYEPVPPCTEHRWAIPVKRVVYPDGTYSFDQDYDRDDAMQALYANRGHIVALGFCRDCGVKDSEVAP